VIFPEGGRTKTGKLMPFKMGAFRMALTHGIPIVPVTIKGGRTFGRLAKCFQSRGG
jgi:1-acyl-sn-glycerol-3-phosphate acyltransferase